MTKFFQGARSRWGSALSTCGAAVHVARAVESGRKPSSGALRTLGIDEAAFHLIQRS